MSKHEKLVELKKLDIKRLQLKHKVDAAIIHKWSVLSIIVGGILLIAISLIIRG